MQKEMYSEPLNRNWNDLQLSQNCLESLRTPIISRPAPATMAREPNPTHVEAATMTSEKEAPSSPMPDLRARYEDGLRSAGPRSGVGLRDRFEPAVSFPPTPRRSRSMTQGGRAAASFMTVDDYDDLDVSCGGACFPGWQPGSEPGYDPKLPNGGHASMPTLSAPCSITVVDFSLDRMVQSRFDNESFIAFLQQPKESWARCQWINVDGLSWDVIQAVGARKGLHKLALEDIMNVRNRTKADWYPNHAFIIMTLQKLVHLVDEDDETLSSASSTRFDGASGFIPRRRLRSLRNLFRRLLRRPDPDSDHPVGRNGDVERPCRFSADQASPARLSARELTNKLNDEAAATTTHPATTLEEVSARLPTSQPSSASSAAMIRSLQRFRGAGNEACAEFMEQHSSLAPYNLAIAAEQVSLFLTNDNTVISFFETSAGDVERPIITRLSNPGTILRESCDGSLLVQAIIDAIFDLAVPLTTVYTDLLGDIELDVLTAPSMRQSRALYVCISEINKMLRFLHPIDGLVNGLRDHRCPLMQDMNGAAGSCHESREPGSSSVTGAGASVTISPLTHTYLGDVLDNSIVITEALQQLKQSSENLISLIFNTVSANQNEYMKQLTTVTIIFLPLTFITGFFGQNFAEDQFPEIHKGIWHFWACAVPTAFATVLILMRDMIYSWIVRLVQRQEIVNLRKKTKSRREKRKLKMHGRNFA